MYNVKCVIPKGKVSRDDEFLMSILTSGMDITERNGFTKTGRSLKTRRISETSLKW